MIRVTLRATHKVDGRMHGDNQPEQRTEVPTLK